jgi:PAS domain S-box-containing protein
MLEKKLKEHDATINTLINANPNPFILVDRQGLIRAVNEAVATMAGTVPGKLTGSAFMTLLPGGYVTQRVADAVRLAGSGTGSRFEEESRGISYDNSIVPITDSHGLVQSIAIFCTDITHVKVAELQLKAANEQLVQERNRLAILTAALDSMDDPVIITDAVGTITYVNGAFITRFGFTRQEVTAKHISTLAAPENQYSLTLDGFLQDQKSVLTGKFIARNKYGLNLPFLLKSSPVFEENRIKSRVFVLREELYGR